MMARLFANGCLAFCCAALAWAGDGIDFAKVPREVPKTPTLIADQPLYGIFLFGQRGEKVVWAILDKSAKDAPVFDVLYLDLNADGDLTRAEERFRGTKPPENPGEPPQCRFEIGRFVEPGTQRAHTEFVVTWRPTRVSYQMKWLGGQLTLGCYGTEPDTYGNFSSSPSTAPIFVPGHDQPFRFQHWMSGTLKRDEANDFKVFVGNMGDRPGTFSCVDDTFLPRDGNHYVVATLIYKDRQGQQREARYDLKQRC